MRKLEDTIQFIMNHNIIDIEDNSLRGYLVSKYGDNTIISGIRAYGKYGAETISFLDFIEFVNKEESLGKVSLNDVYDILIEILNILKNSDYANKTERGDSSHGKGVEGEDKQL